MSIMISANSVVLIYTSNIRDDYVSLIHGANMMFHLIIQFIQSPSIASSMHREDEYLVELTFGLTWHYKS